jgi:hypothetical protein
MEVRLAESATCLGKSRNAYGEYEGKSHVEDLGKDGTVTLKCFTIRYEVIDWINLARDTKKGLIVAKVRMLRNAVYFLCNCSQ